MPRPSKYVPPDTLGGKLRAARKQLQLSLAEVAGDHYSTSLISQIERNRVDPSEESLRFLAERLRLPFEDLEVLAHHHRASELEARQYKVYEELHHQASQLIASKNSCEAITLLEDVNFFDLPPSLRWRMAALRGQAYFEKRKFLKAKQDFIYAVNEQPRFEHVTGDQQTESLLLHLHLAGTYRELQQYDEALEEYRLTLQMVSTNTPSGYVAEAHWGLSLITFAQAHKLPRYTPFERSTGPTRGSQLTTALEHAEDARMLYRSVGAGLRAAAVTCHIARIERALGNIEKARTYLEQILSSWSSTLDRSPFASSSPDRRQQEEASIVTVALCTLADIELEEGHYDEAWQHANHALEISQRSYKLRRADAYLMFGRVLEVIDQHDPAIEIAFRKATSVLEDTDRIAPRISAHLRLSNHLSAIGKAEAAREEQGRALHLAELVSASHYMSPLDGAASHG